MQHLRSHKLLLILAFILFSSIFSYQPALAIISKDFSGCCEMPTGLCYAYDNDITNGLSFKKDSCKGVIKEDQDCVDLYYSPTSPAIKDKDSLPVEGVKCIDKPNKLDELKEKNSGLLSKKCLNSGDSIKSCLISAFFSDIGLPGSSQASDSPEAVKGVLLAKVGAVINAVLGLLGIIFLLMIVYAGIQWLVAGDEEKKVTESKDLIRNAITGLAITMFAYGLSYFVFSALTKISS